MELYTTLRPWSDQRPTIKVHALQYNMFRKTLTIINNLGFTDAQMADQAQIIAGWKQYVQGGINATGAPKLQAAQTGTR